MPNPLPLIHVDTREKDRPHPSDQNRRSGTDMLKLLLSHRSQPRAVSELLPAGDFCFVGEGRDGPTLIGVERKRMRDMLNSIRSGRLDGEQLPKLFDQYGENVYLVLESRWKPDWVTGNLVEKRGRDWEPVAIGSSREPTPALYLTSYLASLTSHTPVKLIHTEDPRGTVDAVLALAHSWAKPWDSHRAGSALHVPPQYALIEKASTVRRYAASFRDVGWERSRVVEENFPTIESTVHTTSRCDRAGCEEMVCRPVTPKEFQKMDGFGKVLSCRFYNTIRGIHEDK